MCRFVYVIADRPLPTPEPTRQFRCEGCDDQQADRVRSVAPGRFIYSVYSWQGCGCGFCYESSAELNADLAEIPENEKTARATVIERREKGRESVTVLREFLLEASRIAGQVRLYVTWAGEEGSQPRRQAVVAPTYFDGDAFCLREGDLFIVAENGES